MNYENLIEKINKICNTKYIKQKTFNKTIVALKKYNIVGFNTDFIYGIAKADTKAKKQRIRTHLKKCKNIIKIGNMFLLKKPKSIQ